MTMRTLLALGVALAALTVAGPALGGGWATVGVSPMAPDEAGAVWKMKLNIKQHGRTPLEGLSPLVIISNGEGRTETIQATATGEPGIYAAEVVFPTAGTWTYRIDDDFSRVHTFKALEIVGDGGGSSFPTWRVTSVVVLALALGFVLVLIARRRWLGGAPATAGN
jgi:hypothetical protein